ncbi:hypothetical protein C173_11995 [Paenibacillus sp. FSL R7-277]|uniref:CBO0543 family protein n=1 Tax=unclassified Paenibacillus TaxID=185978 RepID=UPI0003E1EACE|nr:hypothetical protein C173_11995 [Paenibacillus sp. FSL R7-277]
MIINIYFYILIAFILPWIISIHYLKRKPSPFITYVPVVSSIAMLMNIIGFHFDFWKIEPYDIASLPFDFGIYPVLSCFMINSIDSKKYSTLTFLVFYSLLTTIMEYGAFSVGIVDYGNGWNIGWSLVSYLVAYTIVIIYRKLISAFV